MTEGVTVVFGHTLTPDDQPDNPLKKRHGGKRGIK